MIKNSRLQPPVFARRRLLCVSVALTFGIIVASCATAQGSASDEKEARREFRVRYVSAEAIYFNGGTELGVQAGDKVWIMRNGERVVQLEIKYVSEHSASCLLETEQRQASVVAARLLPVRVEDAVLWMIPLAEFQKRMRPAEAETKAQPATSPRKMLGATTAAPKRYIAARSRNNLLHGQVSLQTFGQKDRSPQPFDFFESSAYLRFTMERLGGTPVRLVTRMRVSQSFRAVYAGDLQRQAWSQRVYEIALEYAAAGAPFEFALGRMLRNDLRGVGYLDGLTLAYRVHPNWKLGVFAGAQPDFYRPGFRFVEKKYGGFVQAQKSFNETSNVALMAAGIGQYQQGHINREYLAAQIDCNWMRHFFLTQYVELDLNRAWRSTLGAGRLAMSNAYFSASYYPASRFSCGLSYDTRRLIRTWETRTLADSLFDQNLRQGWRANVALQPNALVRFALDGGWQGQNEASAIYSAGASAQCSNLWRSGVSVSARFSYFGNAQAAGYYPALDVTRGFGGIVYATLGAGTYLYRNGNANTKQANPWERLRLDFNLSRRFYLSSTVENFHGDTMRFVRGFADLGWRF